MKTVALGLATIAWLFVPAGGSDAPSEPRPSPVATLEQPGTPSHDGTILLRVPTWLADLQLKAGRYEFRRVDRGEPLLQVVEVKHYAQFKRRGREAKSVVADVRCRLESSGEAAAETAVHTRLDSGIQRIDWIAFAGEDGRYVPEAVRP